jgi:hypothetical protein
MTKSYRVLCGLGSAVLVAATVATAAIVSVSGEILEIPAPPSAQVDQVESNTVMHVFAERQDFTLPQGVDVDISSPGTVTDVSQYTSTTIAAGTVVRSYLLHHDRLNEGVGARLRGSITFDQDIIGVITERGTLLTSDPVVGNPGTVYESHLNVAARGIDFLPLAGNPDTLTVSADRRTLQLNSYSGVSGTALDELRVLTEGEKVVPTRTSTWGRIKSALFGE